MSQVPRIHSTKKGYSQSKYSILVYTYDWSMKRSITKFEAKHIKKPHIRAMIVSQFLHMNIENECVNSYVVLIHNDRILCAANFKLYPVNLTLPCIFVPPVASVYFLVLFKGNGATSTKNLLLLLTKSFEFDIENLC